MPLFWLSMAFIIGITLAHTVSLPIWVWACLCVIALLTALLHRLGCFRQLLSQIRSPISISFFLLALSLGALRYQNFLPDLSDPTFIASYADREEQVTLEGVLVAPPDVRDQYSLLRLQSEGIRSEVAAQVKPVHGLALVRVYDPGEWRYGDRLRISGVLSVPPEGESFSYRDYLARQGVYAYMSNAEVEVLQAGQGNWFFQKIYAFKARGLATLYQLYPEPEASLLAGILFGVESGIPQVVRQAFNDTGTAHIIVISGFNITILAGLFSTIFGRLLGRWRGALITLLVIAVYTLLVGADAAVVRAAIMGGLSLYAVQLGRRQHGLNLFRPLTLWDVGFQLSFAATLGLVLYAQPFTKWVVDLISRRVDTTKAQRMGGLIAEYLLFTVAAQLTTLPIILYYFQRLSWISFLANPLILPAQPMVMVLGGLAVLAGLVWLPLGRALGSLAWPFAAYTIRMVEFFNRLQGRAIVLDHVPIWLVVAYFVILFTLTLAGTRGRRWLPVVRPGVVLLALGALTLGVWQVVFRLPDGRLHLTLLDTSAGSTSGEALLIQTPNGRYVLVTVRRASPMHWVGDCRSTRAS
jgi:competence protein ComEC